MPLVDLIQVPKSDAEWEQFFFSHRDSHDRIRQAIQAQTGTITGFTITNGGSGYTSIPMISVVGGNGSGVQVSVTITGGVLTDLSVANGQGGVQYVNPIVTISGGGGSGATATATASPNVNLTNYIIYPVDNQHVKDFLDDNQSLHTEMNGVLGLQSSDLNDVDFTVDNQKIAWFYSHYLEHQSAEMALGI